MSYDATLRAMHDAWRLNYATSKMFHKHLVPQTNAKKGNPMFLGIRNGIERHPNIFWILWSTRTRPKDDVCRTKTCDVLYRHLIIAYNYSIDAEYSKSLTDIECERVIIIDDKAANGGQE